MKPTIILNLIVLLAVNGCITKGQENAKEPVIITVPAAAVSSTEPEDEEESQMLPAPTMESIVSALKEAGIHIYTINLPDIVHAGKYELIVSRDTYIGGVKTTSRDNNMGEVKATTYSTKANLNNLTLSLMDKNDSMLLDSWQSPMGIITTTTKKDKQHFLDYYVTPFKNQKIVPGKKIPILVYGSSWIDETTGYHRYCMDLELEPDFSHEAFKRMPGYYIYSIELKEK